MKILISTHSYLLQSDIDEATGKVDDLKILAHGHHYALDCLDKDTVLAKGGGVFLKRYKPNTHGHYLAEKEIPKLSDFQQVHQVLWWKDKILVSNTRFNRIELIDMEGKLLNSFLLGGDGTEDLNHVNSFYEIGDGAFLALLHNRSQTIVSQILYFTLSSDNIFTEITRYNLWDVRCHNLSFNGKHLLYNASAFGKLVVCDPFQGKVVKEISFPEMHTKGLAMSRDYIIIGLSQNAGREDRYTSSGGVMFIDRHSYEIIHTVPITIEGKSCGNINEIRIVSESDYALRHTGSHELSPTDFALPISPPI